MFSDGGTGFQNPIAGEDGGLTIEQLKSPNYSPGSEGWVIRRDGTSEFAGTTVRGSILAKDGNREVEITVADSGTYNGFPLIRLNPDITDTEDGVILADEDPFTGQKSLIITAPFPEGGSLTDDACQIILRSDLQNLTPGAQITAQSSRDIAIEAGRDITLTSGSAENGQVAIVASDATADILLSLNGSGIVELESEGTFIRRGRLTTPTFQNGWTAFGAPFAPPRYIEYPDHTAGLSGVANGGSTVTPVTIFSLPAAYRPAANHVFLCPSEAGRTCQVRVESGGNVVLQQMDAGGTWIGLSGCRWPISGF